MATLQVKLLTSLAKDIKSKKKTRDAVVTTLKSAKILTKAENLTTHYSSLKKIVVSK